MRSFRLSASLAAHGLRAVKQGQSLVAFGATSRKERGTAGLSFLVLSSGACRCLPQVAIGVHHVALEHMSADCWRFWSSQHGSASDCVQGDHRRTAVQGTHRREGSGSSARRAKFRFRSLPWSVTCVCNDFMLSTADSQC